MGLIYLTVDEVLEFHTMILELGGASGVRSEHLLASAVFQPQQGYGSTEFYPTVAEKAAAYAFFLIANHPFVDGNKRTALLAMTTFLDVNGHALVEDEDAIATMFEDVARGVVGQDEFFGWIVNHTRRREDDTNVVPLRSR